MRNHIAPGHTFLSLCCHSAPVGPLCLHRAPPHTSTSTSSLKAAPVFVELCHHHLCYRVVLFFLLEICVAPSPSPGLSLLREWLLVELRGAIPLCTRHMHSWSHPCSLPHVITNNLLRKTNVPAWGGYTAGQGDDEGDTVLNCSTRRSSPRKMFQI